MPKNKIYRGYISSRSINNNIIPQSLQNLKIRDFAKNNNLDYGLSITEYRMKNSYYALNSLKNEIKSIDGVIFFSIYQLPESNSIRKKFLKFFLKKNKTLFFALEDIQLKSLNKIEELEQIYFISKNSIKLVK